MTSSSSTMRTFALALGETADKAADQTQERVVDHYLLAPRHRHPTKYYFLLRSGDSGSGPPRTAVSKELEARDADSFVTILNMTRLGLSGIFGDAVSRSDATGASQAASGFDRRQSIARRGTRRGKRGYDFMRRLIYTAWAAAAIALSLPVAQSFADADGPSAQQREQWRQAREQRLQQRAEILDARLVGFKASLSLTSDQEKNWAPFEAALRNAAKPREPWRRPDGDQARNEGRPSPIDMMRRFSQRMGERSTELAALANATTPLYTSLDDKQKLVFDATLRGFLRPRSFGPGRSGSWRFNRRG
jgi:hypothetical protein